MDAGHLGQRRRGVPAPVVQAHPREPVSAQQLRRGCFGPEVGAEPARPPGAPVEITLGQQPGPGPRRPPAGQVIPDGLGGPAEVLVAQARQAPANALRAVAERGADNLLGALGHDRHDGFAAFETGAQEGQHTCSEVLVGVVQGSGVKGAGVHGDGGHRPCSGTRDSLTTVLLRSSAQLPPVTARYPRIRCQHSGRTPAAHTSVVHQRGRPASDPDRRDLPLTRCGQAKPSPGRLAGHVPVGAGEQGR